MDTPLCTLCPRRCAVDRQTKPGFCGCGATVKLALATLHTGEEPCLCGPSGAGAVFFSGCNLRCVYCQNAPISRGGWGIAVSTARLGEIFLELQDQGAATLDLVTPTPFVPQIAAALHAVRDRLRIPVVYNCGGYESVETLRRLAGDVDVYLPDLKYFSPALSARYSAASDYFSVAAAAIVEMVRQTGPVTFRDGILTRGVLVRHLVLPGCRKDSIALLERLAALVPPSHIYLSLMRQYTPDFCDPAFPELRRRVWSVEYDAVADVALRLGFSGYLQERSSAVADETPVFDGRGV